MSRVWGICILTRTGTYKALQRSSKTFSSCRHLVNYFLLNAIEYYSNNNNLITAGLPDMAPHIFRKKLSACQPNPCDGIRGAMAYPL